MSDFARRAGMHPCDGTGAISGLFLSHQYLLYVTSPSLLNSPLLKPVLFSSVVAGYKKK